MAAPSAATAAARAGGAREGRSLPGVRGEEVESRALRQEPWPRAGPARWSLRPPAGPRPVADRPEDESCEAYRHAVRAVACRRGRRRGLGGGEGQDGRLGSSLAVPPSVLSRRDGGQP